MSDDIRVYWDEGLDIYSICIDGVVIGQDVYGSFISDGRVSVITEGYLAEAGDDVLVYDSAEHAEEDNDEWEFAQIEENLVIPDLDDASIVACTEKWEWDMDDFDNWRWAKIASDNAERKTA